MTSLTRTHLAVAPRGTFPPAGPVIVAGLAGLASLWLLSSLLSAMPQAGGVETTALPHTMAVLSADTSVPDAITVFAGGEMPVDEAAATF